MPIVKFAQANLKKHSTSADVNSALPNANGIRETPTVSSRPCSLHASIFSPPRGRGAVIDCLLGTGCNMQLLVWCQGAHPWKCVMCVNLICHVCYLMGEGLEALNQRKPHVLHLRTRRPREVTDHAWVSQVQETQS